MFEYGCLLLGSLPPALPSAQTVGVGGKARGMRVRCGGLSTQRTMPTRISFQIAIENKIRRRKIKRTEGGGSKQRQGEVPGARCPRDYRDGLVTVRLSGEAEDISGLTDAIHLRRVEVEAVTLRVLTGGWDVRVGPAPLVLHSQARSKAAEQGTAENPPSPLAAGDVAALPGKGIRSEV